MRPGCVFNLRLLVCRVDESYGVEGCRDIFFVTAAMRNEYTDHMKYGIRFGTNIYIYFFFLACLSSGCAEPSTNRCFFFPSHLFAARTPFWTVVLGSLHCIASILGFELCIVLGSPFRLRVRINMTDNIRSGTNINTCLC